MELVEVEAFSTSVNAWVIRTPGRAFPAAVIQGDSLGSLYNLAQSVVSQLHAEPGQSSVALDTAIELRDALLGRLRHYEEVLAANNLGLPYERGPLPKE